MAEIALSTGLTLDEFRTVLKDVRTQVHEWAVEEGILPEAQGPRGGMRQFGGMKGDGQGLYGSGECIND
jgi:hypothetical protein